MSRIELSPSKQRLRLWLKLLRLTRGVEAELRERLRVDYGATLPRFDVMAALFRISSLAALIAMISTPVSAYVIYHNPVLTSVSLFVAAFVWYRHKTNIQRLLKGEEPKIGKKKRKD